jgi:hypothetical protein
MLVAAAACTVFFAAAAGAQTVPATLEGELLTGVPQVTSTCNVSGNSTISYTVSGVSGPPYAGTFFESGIATLGPQPNPNTEAVPVTSFSASFMIDSGPNTVTGTKTLTQNVFIAGDLGFCTDALRSFGVAANYEARIHTPDGTFADQGQAGVALNEYGLPGSGGLANFVEFFQSALLEPIPVAEAADVSGGGYVDGGQASFGFVVHRKVEGGPVTGQWQFINHATGDVVHSLEITDLVVAGNTATFSGSCRNENAPEGTTCSFRVTVQDNGEGSGAPADDTFSVSGAGFTGAGGTVDGNIQIH